MLAINTALFSLPDGNDHNALWIGRRNLDAATAELEKAKTDLNVVLMHHPLDWLNDAERGNVKAALQQHADFVLRGHLHQNEADSLVNSQGNCFQIAAGACYQTREYPNTALFCTVDFEKGQLEILPIHYVDSPNPKWTLDASLFEPPDYKGRFNIHENRNKKSTLSVISNSDAALQKRANLKERIAKNILSKDSMPNFEPSLINTEYIYDVFISYQSNDQKTVTQLAERLREKALRVWYDRWIIKPGDDIFLSVENGLLTSRKLIICMSPNYLKSKWGEMERSTAMFRDPNNSDRRCIPVLIKDCELPATLRRFRYADFRSDKVKGFIELLEALDCGPLLDNVNLPKTEVDTDILASSEKAKQSNADQNSQPAPELLETAKQLIIDILKQSKSVTDELAIKLKTEVSSLEDNIKIIAETILQTELQTLFEIALSLKEELSAKADKKGANAVTLLMQTTLPVKHEFSDIYKVGSDNKSDTDGPIQLIASHRTIAEIIMAGVDRRPTLFCEVKQAKEFPTGQGLLAEVGEVGRDADGKQFEHDFKEGLLQTFESRFDKQLEPKFKHYLRNLFAQGLQFEPSGQLSEAEHKDFDKKLTDWIREEMRDEAKKKMKPYAGRQCKFTYYFVVKTNSAMSLEEIDSQNIVLTGC